MAQTINKEMEVEKNEIMDVTSGIKADISELKTPDNNFFCTIKDDGSRAAKVSIYNAINSPKESLNDHINEVIEVVDVAAFPVKFVDEQTGEVIEAVKIVLIDKKGVTYGAVSEGIYNSLKRIFSIVGMPSWESEPLKVKVKQEKTRSGVNKVNVLELV